MKKSIVLMTTIAFTTAFVSCQKKENTSIESEPATKTFAQIEKASWLIGEWGSSSKEGNLIETWTKESDSTLTATSYFIVGKDTVHSESIVLEQKGDNLFYIPTIKNQNEGKPVTFSMTTANENQLVFENATHDFPKKVTYNKISNDSLVGEISGIKDGKETKESYPMKKKK
jgi:hypothetical protein